MTETAVLLYETGITDHSLLGLVIADKSNAEYGTSILSKFAPQWHLAELLGKTALNIVDDFFMQDQNLFEMDDVVLQDLRCSSPKHSSQRLGGLRKVSAGDYL